MCIIFLINIICNHCHLYWFNTVFPPTFSVGRDLKRMAWRGEANDLPMRFSVEKPNGNRVTRPILQSWIPSKRLNGCVKSICDLSQVSILISVTPPAISARDEIGVNFTV